MATIVGRPDATVTYVLAAVVRALSRGVWGVFVPVALPVETYGQYSVFQTTATLITQVAVLGTPQAIVQQAGRAIPLLGLMVHSFSIAALVLVLAAHWSLIGVNLSYELLAAATASSVAYSIFTARARSRFQFSSLVAAEAAGAAVFAAAIVWLGLRSYHCQNQCFAYWHPIVGEIAAVGCAATFLVTLPKLVLKHGELAWRGLRQLLPAVYSVGALVVFDIIIWRRIEIYFLSESPAGLTGVAVFSLAAQLSALLLLLPNAILDAWQPSLAAHHRETPEDFTALFLARRKKFLKMLMALVGAEVATLPAALYVFMPKYRPWMGYLLALVTFRVLCTFSAFYSSTLYAIGRQRLLYVPVTVASIIGLAANATLTLHRGIPGALVASLLTQGSAALLTIAAYRYGERKGALGG